MTMGRQPKPLAERLMAKVTKDRGGCWLWTGDRNSWGYGRIGEGGRGKRQKLILVHRASYEVHVGPIPKGAHVLHRCDVPACVNPEHLFLGSLSDNVQDCLAKGRHVALKGENNPRSKLTRETVAAIRTSKLTVSELARQHGVSRRAISFALKSETWK
jgi:hypothetical protein